MSFKIAEECNSTLSKEFASFESSYKAREYRCPEVFENPLFFVNAIS